MIVLKNDIIGVIVTTATSVIFDVGEMMYKQWSLNYLKNPHYNWCNFDFFIIIMTQVQFGVCMLVVFNHFKLSMFHYGVGTLASLPISLLLAYCCFGERVNKEQIYSVFALIVTTGVLVCFSQSKTHATKITGLEFKHPLEYLLKQFQESWNPTVFAFLCAIIIGVCYYKTMRRYRILAKFNENMYISSEKMKHVHEHFIHVIPNESNLSITYGILYGTLLLASLSFWKVYFAQVIAFYANDLYLWSKNSKEEVVLNVESNPLANKSGLLERNTVILMLVASVVIYLFIFAIKYYFKIFVFINFESGQVIPLQKPFILIFSGLGDALLLNHTPKDANMIGYFGSMIIVCGIGLMYAYSSVKNRKDAHGGAEFFSPPV